MSYNHQKIEEYFTKRWLDEKAFKTSEDLTKPKKYILDMFPYPSGAGLHVGHPRGYVGSDILSRYYKMNGYNVLHPMGWDAFGLPAENYAKKNKVMPQIITKKNIETFKRQLLSLGIGYDWDREISTTDEKYFKWTQWIFLQLFKKGLAFEEYTYVNWCPQLGTILANEEVNDGLSDIGSFPVFRKPLKQWSLRITQYAQRLDEDLKQLDLWPDKIKTMQKNWIGKSEGYIVKFPVIDSSETVEVYTTRLDTIPSNTFLILAPEHPLVKVLTTENYTKEVNDYIKQTSLKSDLTRQENQEFTGVFTGSYATNPYNNKKLPIWIADFVLANYAKGAVFGDAHDKRDFELAKKYNIPLETNIYPINASKEEIEDIKTLKTCFEDYGVNVDGQTTQELKLKYSKELEPKGFVTSQTNYRLKDWGFSRQRYWGEPIPILYEVNENREIISNAKTLDESLLPLTLPTITDFDFIDYDTTKEDPEPILNRFEDWLFVKGYYNEKGNVITIQDQDKLPEGVKIINFVREGNTMPQWAGSSWYYLRFMDTNNDKECFDKELEKYWGPVDIYIGGAEHAVLHLLYSRFWHKVLYDIGLVSQKEPFLELLNQGLIMAQDGRKMSKSLGNVVNPDDVVAELGADTLRCFEMFIGPFDQSVSWNTTSIIGIRRFLDKIYNLKSKVGKENYNLDYITNYTIKEVTENISQYKFNSAIARMMEWSNEAIKQDYIGINQYNSIIKILSVFAPYVTEQLWKELGNHNLIINEKWPTYDNQKIIKTSMIIAVQINGKVRGEIEVDKLTNQDEALDKAKNNLNVQKYLNGEIIKVIYVPLRVLNIVVK